MTIRKGNAWICDICGKRFVAEITPNPKAMAAQCESSHDVVYVPILREDLHRLIQFIYVGDQSLLTERLMKLLSKYSSQMKGKPSNAKYMSNMREVFGKPTKDDDSD